MVERDAVRRDLVSLLGNEAVSWEEGVLSAHSYDTWSLSRLRLMRGEITARPACVVSPSETGQVSELLRYASDKQIAVVPYGAGSGVCGGVLPEDGSIVVDLRNMDRLVSLNPQALLARVQAGMMGNTLEAKLQGHGFSAGHFPQSIDISTVGGWVATRSAGQFSTRYGSIEDILVALEVVLADGTVVQTREVPRASTGPDLRQIFLGSEGTLGIVTEVTLQLHPLPPSQRLAAYRFADMDSGLEAIRQMVREGWRPPVVRLYDPAETSRNFSDIGDDLGALLLLVSEGPESLTAVEIAACGAICESRGGVALGTGPVQQWLQHRNAVPGFEPFLERGLVLDTIEVAAPWGRIGGVYQAVVAALNGTPGVLAASGHSSHSYPTGTNIYFTFVAKPEEPKDAEALYLRCWHTTMRETLAHGGTIAHHHGVGRIRREWMRQEHGAGLAVLQALKRALDPKGILNPGVLLPS